MNWTVWLGHFLSFVRILHLYTCQPYFWNCVSKMDIPLFYCNLKSKLPIQIDDKNFSFLNGWQTYFSMLFHSIYMQMNDARYSLLLLEYSTCASYGSGNSCNIWKRKKNSFDVLPYGSVLFPMDGYQFQGVISLQTLLANQDGVSKNLLARTRKSHLWKSARMKKAARHLWKLRRTEKKFEKYGCIYQ